ncbi:MAG: hypothetical protein ACYCUM_14270 [Solirubrobacteraceae bacterium]
MLLAPEQPIRLAIDDGLFRRTGKAPDVAPYLATPPYRGVGAAERSAG